MDARNGLRKMVTSLLASKGDTEPFGDEELLLSGGRLESISVIELITYMEEVHGVDFAERGFDPDEFDSIETMLALLAESG